MSDPVKDAIQRAWTDEDGGPAYYSSMTDAMLEAVSEALRPIRELHKPLWDNCINACCSGEQCRHRSRKCEGGCDEYVNAEGDYWPCATARLAYSADELANPT